MAQEGAARASADVAVQDDALADDANAGLHRRLTADTSMPRCRRPGAGPVEEEGMRADKKSIWTRR